MFFKKLSDAIAIGRSQIAAQGTGGLVYVVAVWDDMALDCYRGYRQQLASFAREKSIEDVHIKVGSAFHSKDVPLQRL